MDAIDHLQCKVKVEVETHFKREVRQWLWKENDGDRKD